MKGAICPQSWNQGSLHKQGTHSGLFREHWRQEKSQRSRKLVLAPGLRDLGVFYLLPGGSLWTHTLTHCTVTGWLISLQPQCCVLWNWNTVGAAMRARMSHLSCKPAQPLSSAAQLLGTLYILFRLGASYCLLEFIPLLYGWCHFAPKIKPVILLPLDNYRSFLSRRSVEKRCPRKAPSLLLSRSKLQPQSKCAVTLLRLLSPTVGNE